MDCSSWSHGLWSIQNIPTPGGKDLYQKRSVAAGTQPTVRYAAAADDDVGD